MIRPNRKLILAILAFLATPALAEVPQGEWMVQTNDIRVSFSNCSSGVFCGYIAWMKNHGKVPVGKQMIYNVEKVRDGTYKGNLVNPVDGKRYDGTLTITSPTRMRLKGCVIGNRWLCKGQTGRKVQ